MAAEYRGIFLAARYPLSFVSSRERRVNLFDRRVDGHPPPPRGRGEIRGAQFSAQFRLDLSDIGSPLDTIAMITEISWRVRYGIQCFSLAQICNSERAAENVRERRSI